jgi:hypothetical protein
MFIQTKYLKAMKNNKANRKKFVKAAEKIILGNGGYAISFNEGGFAPNTDYIIPLKDNNINIKLYDEIDHINVYSVFMRFDEVKKGLGNQHSGKHNFHETGEINEVISNFEKFLKGAINY